MQNKIEIIQGDITQLKVDAIVNAANESLLGGGGVDGAIHRVAGKELLEECRKLCGCPTGQSKITDAYQLPCQKVIHTVGPIWRGGTFGERELLASCYRTSLDLAETYQLKSIAFPCISTGVYRFPREEAAHIAIEVVTHYITTNQYGGKVIFCCFLKEDTDLYRQIINDLVNE